MGVYLFIITNLKPTNRIRTSGEGLEEHDSYKNPALDNRDKTPGYIKNLRDAIRILEKIANAEIKIEPTKCLKCKGEAKAKEAYP